MLFICTFTVEFRYFSLDYTAVLSQKDVSHFPFYPENAGKMENDLRPFGLARQYNLHSHFLFILTLTDFILTALRNIFHSNNDKSYLFQNFGILGITFVFRFNSFLPISTDLIAQNP